MTSNSLTVDFQANLSSTPMPEQSLRTSPSRENIDGGLLTCFNKEVQKAYSCSRSSYCCGSGLVDGPSQWDKCCISENPGDHKLGLWWTLGLCMFVMILVAVGVVLYLERWRRGALSKDSRAAEPEVDAERASPGLQMSDEGWRRGKKARALQGTPAPSELSSQATPQLLAVGSPDGGPLDATPSSPPVFIGELYLQASPGASPVAFPGAYPDSPRLPGEELSPAQPRALLPAGSALRERSPLRPVDRNIRQGQRGALSPGCGGSGGDGPSAGKEN
mmetsp:Transcript_33461/g.79364  ORF Transcript_33461/g.79364 Transcript_33461/m.79364 type:complete len:276 (-) Transcript_33461:216-1043(-)